MAKAIEQLQQKAQAKLGILAKAQLAYYKAIKRLYRAKRKAKS